MKKTYVLDTNVLLDNPNIINALNKNDIIIPYKVLEELDKHKYSPGLKGLNARDCSRLISTIIEKEKTSLKQGIKLENGGKLFVKSHKDFNIPEIDESNADDCIIKVALGFSKTRKNIILMSNDVLLKIKANSFGLQTVGYDQNIEIESVKELYKGYKTIPVDEKVMEVFYQNRDKEIIFPFLPKEITKEKLLPNDYLILTNDQIDPKKKPYPILKYNSKKNVLEFVKEKKMSGGKIKPANIEQTMAIDLLMDPSVPLVSLTGISGTGKTLISIAAGLDQVLEHKIYQNIIVLRPMHAVGKDIGYLPGSKEEKLEPWLAPIKDNLRFLLSDDRDNGKKSKNTDYNINMLFDNGTIEIEAMTYIRGRSINNAFIILDESQNVNIHEVKAILTRLGKGTKIVLTGDIEQTDRNDVDSVSNGLSVVIEKFKNYPLSGHVTMINGIRSEISELAAKLL